MSASSAGPEWAPASASAQGAIEGVRLRLVELDVGRIEVDRLAAHLGAEELSRAARFASGLDARRFIVRRGRLRELIGCELGCSPAAVRFATNDYGKPRTAGQELEFNASHSAGLALYAVARGLEVGCDLELRRPSLATPALASRFFSPSEQRMLAALPQGQWTEGFFNCWTRKEALVKGLGLGLSYPLDGFDVSVAPGAPAALLNGPPGWSLSAFEPWPGLHAALALGPRA